MMMQLSYGQSHGGDTATAALLDGYARRDRAITSRKLREEPGP